MTGPFVAVELPQEDWILLRVLLEAKVSVLAEAKERMLLDDKKQLLDKLIKRSAKIAQQIERQTSVKVA